jgi:hypothetical protein
MPEGIKPRDDLESKGRRDSFDRPVLRRWIAGLRS